MIIKSINQSKKLLSLLDVTPVCPRRLYPDHIAHFFDTLLAQTRISQRSLFYAAIEVCSGLRAVEGAVADGLGVVW